MPAAIEARGLVRDFGDVRAVDGVDLTVARGEMLGLVGPDGAGKTTTIRLLTGVLGLDGGEARVLGLDLRHEARRIQRRVGYLSQQFSLYGDLTVDENIEFFASAHDVTGFHARRDELLAFTRLTSFRARLAEQLSGGMKQKLALACTLIHEPELVFLDEPTTGVDPVSRRDFWLILADLLRRDITIVMTTPYLDEAERCTRVALMHEGRVIRTDAPRAVTAGLEGTLLEVRAERPHAAYLALQDEVGETAAQLFGERVHVLVRDADPQAAGQRLRAVLSARGLGAVETRLVPPTLEDAFIQLMRRQDAAGAAADRATADRTAADEEVQRVPS